MWSSRTLFALTCAAAVSYLHLRNWRVVWSDWIFFFCFLQVLAIASSQGVSGLIVERNVALNNFARKLNWHSRLES